MSRVSLFVKTDLAPNGESRTGLSHSEIVTSVDLIPTFDSFVVLWFCGLAASLCSRRKQWERWYVKETQSVQGMQTVESVLEHHCKRQNIRVTRHCCVRSWRQTVCSCTDAQWPD